MLIGEHKLDSAEHVLRSWRLCETIGVDIDAVPIHVIGVDLPAIVESAKIMRIEHGLARIAPAKNAKEPATGTLAQKRQ
jgi:hypothetical protein